MAWNPIIVDGGSPFRMKFPLNDKGVPVFYLDGGETKPDSKIWKYTADLNENESEIEGVNVFPRKPNSKKPVKEYGKRTLRFWFAKTGGWDVKIKIDDDDLDITSRTQLDKISDVELKTPIAVTIYQIKATKTFGRPPFSDSLEGYNLVQIFSED